MRGGCTNCGIGCLHTFLQLTRTQGSALMSKPTFENLYTMTDWNASAIYNSTTRTMLAQALYRFWMLLKCKMKRAGGRLIECTEEYTSKTCSMCGEIKDNLRGCTIYSCSHCGFVHDRDVSAAKNILHMNMQMLG